MSFDLMFQKANELYLNGAYRQAERIYRQILAFAPENADVLNMLGLVAAAQNEHEEAVSCFYAALKSATNPLPVYFNLAVSLTYISKFNEAIEAYEHILKIAPNTKEAYNNLGGIYEKTGDIQKAKISYQKAIELDQNYIDPLVNIAFLEKDESTLEATALKFSASPVPFYYLALMNYETGDYKKALSFILKADQLEESYDIKNLTAQIYLKLSENENAIKYFHQALILAPKSLDALIDLGTLEQNESYLKKAISINFQNPQAHLAYADFLSHENRKAEALEEYRQALLLGAKNAALCNNIALILKDMADYKGALDLFLNAFLEDPENQNIAINMAETLVLLYNSEPDAAIKIAKLWEKNAPENVFAKKTLASFENNTEKQVEGYTEQLFDNFAHIYDERMKEIKYNVFNKIKELELHLEGNILDLGCATGLAPENLKTQNSRWTGVDISENMLKSAKDKKLYETLHQSDIEQFLKDNSKTYDNILCLDVLEYIQHYENIFKLCCPSRLILTIETAPKNIKTVTLSPQGRYQHNPKHIEEQLQKAGYKTINTHKLVLRKENGKDVEGVLFIANA